MSTYYFEYLHIVITKLTNFKFLGILIVENRNCKMQINNITNKLYYGLSLLIDININLILIL